MLLIGAHNAASGEEGYKWRKLFTIFNRTQSKNIREMLDLGVTYFDFEIKKTDRGWVFKHGLWESKCNCESIFHLINEHYPCNINVSIIYKSKYTSEFLTYINTIKRNYPNINFCSIVVNNEYLNGYGWVNNPQKYVKCFLPLDFTSWHTLIPIPILWKQFYFRHPVYSHDYYCAVDFI